MHEKIRREDKVKIDMAIVKELMRYQEELNHSLRKTRYRCKLLPKSDLYPCSTCPKFKVCEKHAKERDYINTFCHSPGWLQVFLTLFTSLIVLFSISSTLCGI